ncbi:MAG: response regulator transcription factor [Chloroflexia bacterium]|nr:response regulator transcription factor [Chloroflexia bacterium]
MEQPIRVLIVDDKRRSRDALRALLNTWSEGQVVGEAANGQAALLLMERLRPAVVLMDVLMPVMDGLSATRAIKERWPQTKVVILTMYGAYQHEALAAGADDFLLKGCPTERLWSAIRGSESKRS